MSLLAVYSLSLFLSFSLSFSFFFLFYDTKSKIPVEVIRVKGGHHRLPCMHKKDGQMPAPRQLLRVSRRTAKGGGQARLAPKQSFGACCPNNKLMLRGQQRLLLKRRKKLGEGSKTPAPKEWGFYAHSSSSELPRQESVLRAAWRHAPQHGVHALGAQ